MDASTLEPDSKIHKLFEGQNHGESVDRLSSLPESIIHHILSFIPTKYVVGTSILSSRWRYLWTSTPILNFSDHLLYSTESMIEDPDMEAKFMNFVDRVLFFHKSNIHKFCLTCKIVHDASRVNAWISTVIWRKVGELVIDMILEESSALPRCLFSCASLTVLKIRLEDVLEIPTLITLSSLKVLNLDSIGFSCRQSIQQVTLSFPILEEFIIKQCAWLNIKAINIFAPRLRRLSIDDVSNYIDVGLYNYEMKMKIRAESLVFLALRSNLSCEYKLHLPSIVDASIDLVGDEEIGHATVELFREICNVKELTISRGVIESLFRADLSIHMPNFFNAINVRLTMSDPFHGSHLMNLLCHTPNIQSLVFTNGLYNCSIEEHTLTLETLPQSCLLHLKSIELRNFYGHEEELRIIKFLLKNARVLEKMTIISVKVLSADPKKQMELSKQLLMLPRVSACSVIDFC